MISEEKLNRIKAILQKIIANVYLNKDKLCVIGFKGRDSEVIIPNTKRPNSFMNKLQSISVGGTTPMAAGLEKALEVCKSEIKSGEYLPMIMILSDGVANVGLSKSKSQLKKSPLSRFNKNKEKIEKYIKDKNSKSLISNPINDVLAIGEEIAHNNIHTVIVNFEKDQAKGRSVNKELTHITKGRFYDLSKMETIIEDLYQSKNKNNSNSSNSNNYDTTTNSDSNNNENDKKTKSVSFGSFKSDLSDMVVDEILNFERDSI
jgi:magnesium chelatase subunit D